MGIVYLNGDYLPIEDAKVSVLDRGFIFGDGIYEVIPVFRGKLYRLQQHLSRLAKSLTAVRIENPHSDDAWAELLQTVVERNGGGHQSVYLQITRGVARRDHLPQQPLRPTVFVMSNPMEMVATPAPVCAILCPDTRWEYCYIKSIALLPNVLLRYQAADAGAYEAILIRDGLVSEGAASNVFIASGERVLTPPCGPSLLPGITRDLVVELLREHGLSIAEAAITEQQIRTADEIWLTSSTREILPVVKLDHRPVGAGAPGPLWRQAYALYQEAKNTWIERDGGA